MYWAGLAHSAIEYAISTFIGRVQETLEGSSGQSKTLLT